MDSRGSMTHVVIEGGGFAWLACARKLAKSDVVHVTLIDENIYHQFQPFLYQVAPAERIPAMCRIPFVSLFAGTPTET